MGWKAACIFCTDATEPQYFSKAPEHLPDEATRIANLLGYKFQSRESCEFNDYPEENSFVIGAYEKGVCLADQNIIFDCFENREHPYFKTALQLYPDGELLMVIAHSTTNTFGYALYKKGTLIREYSGSSDDGVISEVGEIQPEESAAFAKSVVRDGTRYFKVDLDESDRKLGVTEDEYTADCYGEELCFMMIRRYLGGYMSESEDSDDDDCLMAEQFFKNSRANQSASTKGSDSTGSLLEGIKRLFGI